MSGFRLRIEWPMCEVHEAEARLLEGETVRRVTSNACVICMLKGRRSDREAALDRYHQDLSPTEGDL